MVRELTAGITGKTVIKVDEEVSAKRAASGEMDVFGTPFMIALMERTADESVRPYLEDGCATVGTLVNVKHIAATPMGMEVYATSELIEVDGRRLVYKVYAYDETGLIGEGIHERFIIFKEKFMEKTNNKVRG